MVAPGAVIATDDWSGYLTLPSLGYTRRILNPRDLVLPHLVASLFKRWLLGTYQGAVRPTHLAYYLDEFTFRFNRRTSRSRGKLLGWVHFITPTQSGTEPKKRGYGSVLRQ